ncbi:unnamed protein product, partial [Durusdinium trenchii]
MVLSYVASVADEAEPGQNVDNVLECTLLCEADDSCRSSRLIDATLCKVQGDPAPRGTPLTPLAEEDAYSNEGPLKSSSVGSVRKVLLVTYASGKIFEETQQKLHESLGVAEIEEHWRWNRSSFESGPHGDWYRRHQRVNFQRGGAWKPYIIWQAFRRVKWGEWLVYHDASRYVQEGFSSSVQPLLDWLESHQNENPCQCLPAVRLRQSFEHEWLQQCVPPYGTAPVPSDQAADVFCGLMQKLGTCRP